MREQNIRIEPFHFLNIRRLQIQKSSNEHPTVYVEGTILDTETDAVVERSAANRKLTINAVDDSGGVRTLFNGLIKEIGVHTENGLRILSIQGFPTPFLWIRKSESVPFKAETQSTSGLSTVSRETIRTLACSFRSTETTGLEGR